MLPIITIARQYGSGGHEVGERLAEKLNVPLLDKQLIAMAAKKSGLSEEVFEKADEKAGNSLLYSMVMGNYTFGSRITGINDMPINDKLFILQSDIIKSAADKGPCVIIGRCGDYILREYDNVFRVFIHAAISKERITTTSTRISAGMISRIITSPSILPNSILTRLRRSSLRPSARSNRPQRSKPLHIQFEFTLPFIFFIFYPFRKRGVPFGASLFLWSYSFIPLRSLSRCRRPLCAHSRAAAGTRQILPHA